MKAKSLKEAIMPLLLLYWVCGILAIELPIGRRRPILSILYALLRFGTYGALFWYELSKSKFGIVPSLIYSVNFTTAVISTVLCFYYGNVSTTHFLKLF